LQAAAVVLPIVAPAVVVQAVIERLLEQVVVLHLPNLHLVFKGQQIIL
jgi:hypothetical protein